MSLVATLMAAASIIPVAASAVDADAMRAKCESASVWAPVNMPEARINTLLPCNDAGLRAFMNAHEARKKIPGLAGCTNGASTFEVMYFVNTPAGFIDKFVARPKANTFTVSGHRIVRVGGQSETGLHNEQVIEVDEHRAVMLAAASPVANSAAYTKLASCFFSSFEIVKP